MATPVPIFRRARPVAIAATLTASLGLFLSASPATAASGCDSIASVPITWNIDYAVDIQGIFNNRCSNCHVDHGGTPLGDLDLNPEFSWDDLVNAPSNSQPGRTLVVPGEPLDSVLFEKINCDQPDAGLRMPRNRTPLPFSEQALIYDWIMLGAPRTQTDFVFVGDFESRP
jgi:hypothetical protein